MFYPNCLKGSIMAQKITVTVSINLLDHASDEDIALLKARVTDAVDQAAGLEVISEKKFQEIYGGQEVTSDVRELDADTEYSESEAVNSQSAEVIDHSDPYPWRFIDKDGEETRTHTAHKDGLDEYGNHWGGWVFAPRSKETLSALE